MSSPSSSPTSWYGHIAIFDIKKEKRKKDLHSSNVFCDQSWNAYNWKKYQNRVGAKKEIERERERQTERERERVCVRVRMLRNIMHQI